MKQIYQFLFIMGFMPVCLTAQQYSQSFDSETMPSDWTVINGGDSGEQWKPWAPGSLSLANSHSGSHFLGLQYGSSAHDDYAISPAITVTAGVSDKLSFWSRNKGSGLAEQFDVKISTTTPTADAFTNTMAAAVKPPTAWTKYSYDLTPYIGQTIYIAFYSSTNNVWFIGIDDFEISSNSLGTSEVALSKASIYPNPVTDVVNIKNKNKMSEITVYDLTGKLHKKETVNSDQAALNVSDLTAGNYLIKIKEGQTEKTYKIIKK